MYYDDVLEAFFRAGARYLLVGGLAVVMYGIPRSTQDIDLIISTDKDNVQKIISSLAKLDYAPRLPVDPNDLTDPVKVREWVEKRNLKAFSFYHKKDQYKIVDLVLVHPLDFEKSFKNRTERMIGGFKVNIVSIDDLIKMKENADREQDRADTTALKKVRDDKG